jgi:hypothetical protein
MKNFLLAPSLLMLVVQVALLGFAASVVSAQSAPAGQGVASMRDVYLALGVATIAAVASVISQVLTYMKVTRIEINTNSKMDRMLVIVEGAAHARGMLAEHTRAAEEHRVGAAAASAAEALVTKALIQENKAAIQELKKTGDHAT